MAVTDSCQGGVRIEGGQFAPVSLLDADGDLAAKLGQPGVVIAFLKQPQGGVNHLSFRSVLPGLDEGADELLAVAC
jgi:hypothetical protein